MKHPHLSYSPLIMMLVLIILSPNLAFAEKITVKKTKGNQSIIESSSPLEEGQTYEVSSEKVSQDVDYKSNILKSRANSLTLGSSFDYLKSDTIQNSNFSLQIRYGWNFSTLEVGALLETTARDQGTGSTVSVVAGGYLDYNLVPNREPKKIIYGPFLLTSFGSTTYPSSGTGGSSTSLNVNMGGFLSYFIGESSTALRAEAFGIYQQVNTTALQSSLTGAGFRGLLVFYF